MVSVGILCNIHHRVLCYGHQHTRQTQQQLQLHVLGAGKLQLTWNMSSTAIPRYRRTIKRYCLDVLLACLWSELYGFGMTSSWQGHKGD